MRYSLCLFALLLFGALTACHQRPTADAVYHNGIIYTVDSSNSEHQSFAVSDGTIEAIGSNEAVSAYIGPSTQVIDLQGHFVMPGIQDMHMHPVDGGIKGKFECAFADTLDAEAITRVIADCVSAANPGDWILGGQWGPGLLLNKTDHLLELLDSVSPDNPVFIMDWALHAAWANSLALDNIGISSDSPDPVGGVIMKRTDGQLTGILLDNSAYQARHKIPYYTPDQIADAIAFSIDQMLAHGITSYKDALTPKRNLVGYQTLRERGDNRIKIKTSLAWKSAWSRSHDDELTMIKNFVQHSRENLDTAYAKIMLDGIPPTYTAALLEPYNATPEFGDNHYGKLMLEPNVLATDVTKLDALGLTVKIHATGDRSIRIALDAIEKARKINGDSGLRHEVSHAELIHPDDLSRFAELNVAAEMCPILWYPGPAVDAMRIAMGDRANQMWPVRSLVNSGALVFYGSDWPSVVPDTNPWPGIEAMVTRKDPYERFEGDYWLEEAVDLATALRIFTINGATAGKQAAETGSLEVGKAADFIVLDRNPFTIAEDELSDVQAVYTYIDGVEVWAMNPRGVK